MKKEIVRLTVKNKLRFSYIEFECSKIIQSIIPYFSTHTYSMKETLSQLKSSGILEDSQFTYLESIESNTIFSLFYELRTLLYLGVLLLTAGIGFLVYLNLSSIGHIILIALLIGLDGLCIYYVYSNQLPYSNNAQEPPTPYFDYVVLLGSLTFASIITYILIQTNTLDQFLSWSTLFTSILLLAIAFRYDHRGVLALGLTAFAGFWGLSLSPVQWAGEEFNMFKQLNITALVLGGVYYFLSLLLTRKNIKPHFSFTFENFGLLLFFAGCINGIFGSYWPWYSLLALASGAWVSYHSWGRQKYLFFVLGVIVTYIAFTRFVFVFLFDILGGSFELGLFYFMASTAGLIFLIQRVVSATKKTEI